MLFIDIHTHNKIQKNFALINLFPDDISEISETKFYSAGIHPWEVTKINIPKQLFVIENAVKLKNIIAVGEIGLDKLRPDFELQKDVFLKQLHIAATYKKPLIIHCVKAYFELLEILKKENLSIPIIIHRYSGNITIAAELIKFGCFFSFGHELFNEKSKTPKVFKKIPVKNIFLETDDADISIEKVYEKAAEIKEVSTEEISEYILSNFKFVFGNINIK
ncbi:MAG: TatD family hydrolase [Bacteroidales bacterium]|nr:TatD family hydrolase [Bacteroidales bacterium]